MYERIVDEQPVMLFSAVPVQSQFKVLSALLSFGSYTTEREEGDSGVSGGTSSSAVFRFRWVSECCSAGKTYLAVMKATLRRCRKGDRIPQHSNHQVNEERKVLPNQVGHARDPGNFRPRPPLQLSASYAAPYNSLRMRGGSISASWSPYEVRLRTETKRRGHSASFQG